MTTPNVENLKKRAKHLLRQLRARDPEAIGRIREGLPRVAATPVDDVPGAGVTLQEVQHVIAVEHGFSNWKQVLAATGTTPRRRRRTLHVRPGLQSLVEEAEWLLWMVGRKQPWSLDRIRRLPRLAGMSDAEVAAAGVSLEDARQVVATDYGYADWSQLQDEADQRQPVTNFEDLAGLEDDQIREIVHRVGRDRLAVVMKAVSAGFRERVRACLDEDEWQVLATAIDALRPMPRSEVEAAQASMLQRYRTQDPLV